MAVMGEDRLDGRAIFGKIMAVLVDLALLVVKFVAQRFFRMKMDEPPKAKTKCLLETVPEADESEEEEGELVRFNGEEEEEYTSSLSFKFEYQVPELVSRRKEEEEEEPSVKSTTISNCQFSSEKGFRGFFAEPEAMTCSIHESFAGPAGEEELAAVSTFVSAKDFVGGAEGALKEEPSAENHEEVTLSEGDEAFDCADEEKALSELFSAKEFFRNSFIDSMDFMLANDGPPLVGRGGHKFLSSKGFEKSFKELKDVLLSKNESFVGREDGDYAFPKHQDDVVEEEPVAADTKTWVEKEASQGFSGFDSDSDSVSSRDGYSVRSLAVDCDSDGFLSEKDFSEEEESLMEDIGGSEGKSQLDEAWSMNDSSDELELELKELKGGEAEESPRPSSSSVLIELTDSSEDELLPSSRISASATNSASPTSNRVGKKEPEGEESQKSVETRAKDLEAEELDELESLWEHQDLIEQLKMELKKARAVGLPTIFEESESPREIEDLKPWKIDEKFSREDPMDELHKFYKSYRERMRKFDILNYQKMYAMGFLQLKAPLESMGSQKPLIPTVLSHLSQTLRPLHRRRKPGSSASDRFLRELQVDLETVYVGQTCLSWEFLRWQYEKARELPETDPYRSRRYNQVAGEFQQFQVVARRFIEDEPFQGPRLPNYVKNRCVLRNLLQVPVIKEDCLKEKMEERRRGCGGGDDAAAITSEMLEDIMEESIRIFWEFIKADKDENSAILKTLIGNQVELQDPSDCNLMADVHATLHKKEKKLRDILKTGNCLVKKFKKPKEEDRSNRDLFFSQVDMKLVSRVLKMSRITRDQLVWCHMKLDKIKIAERKIHREPSFLLFPC